MNRVKTIINILIIAIISLNLIACEDNKSSNNIKEEKEVKITPSLPIPEWNSKIAKFSNSNGGILYQNAKTDPSAATKIGYAYSEELKDYDKAIKWYKYSNSMKPTGVNSNYMCYAYQMKKDYDEAINWCKNAIDLGNDDALIGLGFSYSKLGNYKEAVKWYLKASESNHPDSMINLGSVYTKLKDNENAEKWYKKAIKKDDLAAYQGIAKMYHDNFKDNIKASAYAIALINTKYTKNSVVQLLQKTWKIPNNIIQKGYELQLNSDEFPIKYKGKLDLDE